MNKAIYKLSHGIYVLTTKDGGCIVDAVSQVSGGDEPLVSVAVMKSNNTNLLMHKENEFALSIIGEKSDMSLIDIYGYHSMKDYNKFENSETKEVDGLKVMPNSIGYIILEKVDTIENETHTLFIGKVKKQKIFNDDKELTYNNFREHKNELLKTKTENNKTAWVCQLCGYVYYGEELPDDFTCPLCGADRTNFEKKKD